MASQFLKAFPSLRLIDFELSVAQQQGGSRVTASPHVPLDPKWVRTEMPYSCAAQIFGACDVIAKTHGHKERTDKTQLDRYLSQSSKQVSSHHSTDYWPEKFTQETMPVYQLILFIFKILKEKLLCKVLLRNTYVL